MEKPKLYGTPLSHFTRKIRIILLELDVPFETVRPPDLLGTAAATYGENPLMRIPTLAHDGLTIIDSDHIARYVVSRFDPEDRFGVATDDVDAMNRLAVANGVMANEVVLILAKRGGLADVDDVAYFRKLRAAMDSGLAWLDAHTEPDAPGLRYADIATICMWEHAAYYELAPRLERHGRIAARVARFSDRPSVASTTPAASIAAAASWEPRGA